ncbi:MAG: hypothetical protein J6Y08_04405 [Clostridiales bacterium]|nr:hypothetical protein [Clostridiales bacterium]
MKKNKNEKPQNEENQAPIENVPASDAAANTDPDLIDSAENAPSEAPEVASLESAIEQAVEPAAEEITEAAEAVEAVESAESVAPAEDIVSEAQFRDMVDNVEVLERIDDMAFPADENADESIVPTEEPEESWEMIEPQPMELGAHEINSLANPDDPDAPAFQETSTRRADAVPSGKGKKMNWKPKSFIIILAAICLVIVVLFVISMGRLNERLASPLTVGSQEVSNAEFSFMYHYVLLENGVDIFKPNTEQMLSGPGENGFATYREYFLDITAKEIQSTYMLYDDAIAHGYSISPEHHERAQAYIDWLKGKADALHIDLNTYIKGAFGAYVTKDLILDVLPKVYFAEDYAANMKLDELKATPEQAEQAYQDSRNSYDLVSFRVLRMTFEAREENYVTTANIHAEEIIAAIGHDESKFESVAAQYFSGEAQQRLLVPDSTLHKRIRYSEIDEAPWRNWLFDPLRTSGDCTIFHDEYGFPIIFCFVERVRQEEPLRNVRFFYIYQEDPELGIPGVPSADIIPLSQSIFDSITDEASMITLETTYADELLEGSMRAVQQTALYPGNNPQNIDDWIFDPARKSGDKILFDEGDSQILILFYVEASPNPEWYDRVNSFIRMDNYQAFVSEHIGDYAYTFHEEGLKYIEDVPS